jgi:hypothetical protein
MQPRAYVGVGAGVGIDDGAGVAVGPGVGVWVGENVAEVGTEVGAGVGVEVGAGVGLHAQPACCQSAGHMRTPFHESQAQMGVSPGADVYIAVSCLGEPMIVRVSVGTCDGVRA